MPDPNRPPEPPALLGTIEESRRFGFLGPGPVGPQIAHAHAFVDAVGDAPGPVLDLGSGGGLPGLVLAVRRPADEVVLLDAMARRTEFLTGAVAGLDLAGRVRVVCARAEEAARTNLRGHFSVVVARSFGPPAVTAECAVGFLRPGGLLVVSEPPHGSEARWDPTGLETLGLALEEIVGTEPRFVRIRKVADGDRWPRRTGVPAKRPVWS